MENSEQKMGKVFLVFAGICIVALPFIVFSAFSFESEDLQPDIVKTMGDDFDQSGKAIFINYDQLSEEYLAGTDPNLPSHIFSDGFESGDTSAWS